MDIQQGARNPIHVLMGVVVILTAKLNNHSRNLILMLIYFVSQTEWHISNKRNILTEIPNHNEIFILIVLPSTLSVEGKQSSEMPISHKNIMNTGTEINLCL